MIGARLSRALRAGATARPTFQTNAFQRMPALRVQRGYASSGGVKEMAVRDALNTLAEGGVKLPPPFTAEVIATWVAEFWLGMEFADLIGEREERARHQEALDAMQHLLEDLDARVRAAAKPVRRRK